MNPGDTTVNLAGNILEKVQTEYTVQIAWQSITNPNIPWKLDVDGAGNARFERSDGGSFLDDGFFLGDLVEHILIGTPTTTYNANVTYVDDDVLILGATPLPVLDTFTSDSTLNGLTPLEGVQFFYNLIENNEATGFLSKIDASLQGFFADGVGTGGIGARSTATIPMVPLGSDRSWLFGTVTVAFVQDVIGVNTARLQEFKFIHEYIVLPWYLDGELTNIQNLAPPALFDQGGSLKYVGQYDFLSTLNNPNTMKSGTDDNVLGSTGWFNESNNGFTNDYQTISIQYDDTSAVDIGCINAADTTSVTIRLGGVNFSGSTVGVLAISKLPEADEYQNNTNFLAENFLLDTRRFTVGAAASSTILTDVEATVIGATELEIVADISYTPTELLNIEEGDNYILAIIIEDDSLTNQTTNRVTQLIDVNQFKKSANVPDLMTIDESEGGFYSHLEDIGGVITSDYKGWIEDGVLLSRPFRLNIDLLANITQMFAKILVTDGTTEFELESYQFDLSNSFIDGGNVQNISLDTTRGFQLLAGDQFNLVKIENLGQSFVDGANREKYNLFWALKIPFEKWIANADVPTTFTDFAKQQNGLNQNAANYSGIDGYEVYVQLNASVSDGAVETSYQFRSPALEVYDYDQSNVGVNPITCSFTTEDSNGVDLGGQLLQDQDTIVIATFTNTTPGELDDCVGITRLYESETGANAVYELSSIREPKANQPIIGIVGGPNLLKVQHLGGGVVKTFARVDGTQLKDGASYCITPRLFCDVSATVLIVDINATFIGGPSGTWDIDLTMVDGDTNPLPNGTNAVFTFKDGITTIGTLAYQIGDVIGVNPPQSTTGIGTNILNYMTGTIGDGQTLTFDKRTWAETECFLKDAIFDTAVDLIWCFQANNGVVFSNVDDDTTTKTATISAFEFPNVGNRYSNTVTAFVDATNTKISLIDVNGFSRTVGTQINAYACAVDFNDISNGQPVILSVNFAASATIPVVTEWRFDGKNFIATVIKVMTKRGVFRIDTDTNKTYLGKTAIWTGHARGNTTVPNRGFERLTLLEWNGAGYTEHDFQPLIEAIFVAHAPVDTNVTIQNMIIADNSDIYIAWRSLNSTNNGLFRLRQTGPTYENPADWSFKLMTGVAPGNADGTGAAAQTNVLRGLGIIGYDGVLNQQTGTNPEIIISDAAPNVSGIRSATHAIGPDEYTTTKIIGGVTSGDLDGTGTLARFQTLRDSIGLLSNDKAIGLDQSNQAVYLLDVVANTSAKIGGQNSPGDENQIEY